MTSDKPHSINTRQKSRVRINVEEKLGEGGSLSARMTTAMSRTYNNISKDDDCGVVSLILIFQDYKSNLPHNSSERTAKPSDILNPQYRTTRVPRAHVPFGQHLNSLDGSLNQRNLCTYHSFRVYPSEGNPKDFDGHRKNDISISREQSRLCCRSFKVCTLCTDFERCLVRT